MNDNSQASSAKSVEEGVGEKDPAVLAHARRVQWTIALVGGLFMIIPVVLAYLLMRGGQ